MLWSSATSEGAIGSRRGIAREIEDMQRHYSTVRAEEIRSSLRRVAEVVDLAAFRSSGVQGGVHEKRRKNAPDDLSSDALFSRSIR